MQLVKLGPPESGASIYAAHKPVEGYSSLIWTERYREAGDFQLKTPRISEAMALIPDGSLLAVQDSEEIMRVETHSIDTNDEGVEELTIVGRSFETFLEQRQIRADSGYPFPMKKPYTVQEAVAVVLHQFISINNNSDVINSPYPHSGKTSLGIPITIQNIVLQKPVSTTTPPDLTDLQSTTDWYLTSGEVYKQIRDWLTLGDLGLRSRRPPNTDITGVVGVNGTTGAVGVVAGNTGNGMVMEIYNGRNRSVNPSPNDPLPPVIFRADAGHLITPKYIFSRRNYKNYVRALTTDDEVIYWEGMDGYVAGGAATAPKAEPSGINRYELFLDLGTVDVSVADPTAWMRQQARAALKSNNRQVAVDAAVSPKAPYRFGVHYGLGDLVTVDGKYGTRETMMVSEYVRSQDQDGERAYPTLVRIDPPA